MSYGLDGSLTKTKWEEESKNIIRTALPLEISLVLRPIFAGLCQARVDIKKKLDKVMEKIAAAVAAGACEANPDASPVDLDALAGDIFPLTHFVHSKEGPHVRELIMRRIQEELIRAGLESELVDSVIIPDLTSKPFQSTWRSNVDGSDEPAKSQRKRPDGSPIGGNPCG